MYFHYRSQLRLSQALDQTKGQMMETTASASSFSSSDSGCSTPAYHCIDSNSTGNQSGRHPYSAADMKLPLPLPTSPPPASTPEIRVLKKGEAKRAAHALAEAFEDDAMAQYFTHTDDRSHCTKAEQWRLHLTIMEHITKAHLYSGLVTAIGDNYDCVALWMPPGTSMDNLPAKLRGGMQKWKLGPKLSPEGKTRFFSEFLPKLHDAKLEILKQQDENSWYLVYVGTRPQSRGKGLARKLIEHTLKQADLNNQTCYLESSNTVNNRFYHKLGFEDVSQIRFERSDPAVVLDVMTRQPHATTIGNPTVLTSPRIT